MPEPMKLSGETKKRIASFICKRAIACRRELASELKDIWKECSLASKNQPIGDTVTIKNCANRVYPIIQPRINALVKNVANPITSISPYYFVKRFGGDDEAYEATENGVQFLMETGNWRKATKRAVRSSGVYGLAIIQVEMVVDDTTGQCNPVFTVIQPDDFIAYPAGVKIEDCVLTGRVFNELRGDIKRRQQDGEYFDCEFSDGPSSMLEESNVRDVDNVGVQEDQAGESRAEDQIFVGQFIVRLDPKVLTDDGGLEDDVPLATTYYVAKVAIDSETLLSFEPFGATVTDVTADPATGVQQSEETFIPYDRPWYFEYSFTESQQDELFRENWFARDLIDIQRSGNENWSLWYNGTMANAFPAIFAQGDTLTSQNIDYGFGTITFTSNPMQIQQIKSGFDQGAMPGIMQVIERLADSVGNMAPPVQGQGLKADTTATEAQGVLASQNASMDEYRENAASCGEPICEWLRKMGALYYQQIVTAHPEFAGIVPNPQMLAKRCVWEPNGKSGDNQPNVIMAKMEMLMMWSQRLGVPLDPAKTWVAIINAIDAPINKQELMNAIQRMLPIPIGGDPSALPPGQTGGQPGPSNPGGPPPVSNGSGPTGGM